jgi:hypothetical protein
MLLTVENKTLNTIVLNAELGSVGPRKTVILDLTIDQIERSRTDLVRLATAGAIVWSTAKTTDASDDAGEAATIAYVDAGGGGGGAVTSVAGKIGAVVLDTDDINVSVVGNPVHITQLTQAYDHFWSAGSITGFDLTDNGDGTVSISAGESLLREAATQDAPLHSIQVPASNNIPLVDGAANYVFTDWNGGTPIVATSTVVTDFNCLDKCLLWTVCREGTELHVLDGRRMNVDANRKHRRVLLEAERFRKTSTGTAIGTPGNRNITLTSGRFYYALNQVDHGSYDTSVAGTALANVFRYYYRNGSGGWVTLNDQKQINNLNYDDGTGVLATLTNNRFRTDWVYLVLGAAQRLVVLMGRNNSNSLAEAVATPVPSDLPPTISNASVLVGQVVVQRAGLVLSSISSAFEKAFVTSSAVEHNNLAGLQGGSAGQYLHLTSAEHSSLATSARTLRGLRGFTSTDFYERAAGSALQGNANPGFEVMVAVVVDILEGGGYSTRQIVSNTSPFNPPGYMVGIDDIRPTYAITDGGGSRFGVFFGNWARAHVSKALLFLNMGYDNAAQQRFLVVNGQDFIRASQIGFTPDTTLPVRLGANASDASLSARGLTVVGYAMRTAGALTSDQRFEAMRSFLTTGDFADTNFNHRFSMKSLALGAAPATLTDVIGGLNMSRTGSALVVVDEYYVGQAITTTPSPDDIVSLNGGFLVWPNQLVNTAGPTTITANSVRCDTSSVAPIVTLPAFPFPGFEITVFDLSGNAAANNITINGNGGQLINGIASAVISTNFGYRRLTYDGTNWTIVGSA